jgi:xanthine dehydrogenase accessory factor
MISDQITIVVRGGGDIATGSIYRLCKAGFSIVVLEIEKPRVVRRAVAAAQCVYVSEHVVEGVAFQQIDIRGIKSVSAGIIPVVVDPTGQTIDKVNPNIVIDARMLKRDIDSSCDLADLVVGLGPGFIVGDNCDVVVETQRGHNLGRVYSDQGSSAIADTGVAEQLNGYSSERVLRAPCAGIIQSKAIIGDVVLEGEIIASVGGKEVLSPFSGVLRGLIQTGLKVHEYDKIGDIDPRGIKEYCFQISDKSLAIGGGVLEAALTWMSKTRLQG